MGELPDDVEGGAIVRYANGKPTGRASTSNVHAMLRKSWPGIMVDNAMNLIPNPPLSERMVQEYFDVAIKDALAHGLTSIHDADTKPEAISLFKK
jgi:hypothetical protein